MDQSTNNNGVTAATIVNGYTTQELTRILYEFGQEECAAEIAQAIVHARRRHPITSTNKLATIISQVVYGLKCNRHGVHPATKTFQAIRMEVNQELVELEAGINSAIEAVDTRGAVLIVSFHSLEEKIVEKVVRKRNNGMSLFAAVLLQPKISEC